MSRNRRGRNQKSSATSKAAAPVPVGITPSTAGQPRGAPLSVRQAQDVEYYAALANGWVTNRMEHDKTLLTLSTGGIGLFLTLVTTVGARSTVELVCYAVGTLCFGAALILGLTIFRRNADFLERVIENRDAKSDPKLAALDKWLMRTFACGALFAALGGGAAAYVKFQDSHHPHAPERPMTGKGRNSKGSSDETLMESLTNIRNICPPDDQDDCDVGSLHRVQMIKPTSPPVTLTKPTTTVPPTSSSTTKK